VAWPDLAIAAGHRVGPAEAIVCAGAVGCPQLLLLSGPGPAGQLRDLGLPVVADLPGVGENLQDYPNVLVSYASGAPLPRSRYNHGPGRAPGHRLVSNLSNFLGVLLVLFIPWSAVNLADYFLVRHGSYDIPSFFTADGAYGEFALARGTRGEGRRLAG
jgi:GMC oxidoreductase